MASAVSMKVPKQQVALLLAGLWLARNERRDPYSSPYITHYSSFHFLSHSFISILNTKPYITPIIPIVSIVFSMPCFTASQRPVKRP